jgi:hypothetical protein
MPNVAHPQKITFAEMRASGVHGLLVYCADYRCSRMIKISADQWADECGCLILSRASCARPAASAVRMCGRTSIGTRSRSRRWGIDKVHTLMASSRAADLWRYRGGPCRSLAIAPSQERVAVPDIAKSVRDAIRSWVTTGSDRDIAMQCLTMISTDDMPS